MISDVVRFVLEAGGGVSLSRLRTQFPTAGVALRSCLERNLLEVRGQCYYPTTGARLYLDEEAAQVAALVKRCPGCGHVKPASEYWKDASHSHGEHGLYAYCKTCCKLRKERLMEAKQAEARELIRAAAPRLVQAAQQWDAGVAMLAGAWREIMGVEQVLRLNRRAAGIECDHGRMEAQHLYQNAMYGLLIAMADVQFRIDLPFMRDAPFKTRLAEFVGTDPQRDYLGDEGAAPIELPKRRKERAVSV